LDWHLTVDVDPEEALRLVDDVQRTTLLTGLGGLVLAGVLALFVAQLLTGPITRLTGVAQQIASGNLQTQAIVESQDETGQLAQTFNSMTTQLRGLIGLLEDQVQARTAELALSMTVGQRAAAIRELTELLPTITEFIRHQFNLYYTQVYFVDSLGENLVLQSGTGTVGQELLSRQHSLPVGAGSIVGRVATGRKSIVVPDTENSEIHKANPLLPETRSELAIPLIVEDQVIGVLDMQADQINTFTETNMTVFEAMATQLAVAIDSAQQWAIAQDSQRRLEDVVRRLTRDAWGTKLAPHKGTLGFAYDLSTITPLPSTPQNGGVSVPVAIQNERIGHLSVTPPPNGP
jgi:putative methionine-R-sulfoxide reductase with GAF domain